MDDADGTTLGGGNRLMNSRSALVALAAAALLAGRSAWTAPAGEQWTAYSTTARAITGDITLSPDRITFGNGKSLPLAPAGNVPDFKADDGKTVNGTLYRVTAPDDPLLLNENRLCGGREPHPATFVVVWKRPMLMKGDPDLLTIAPFSGSEQPREAGGATFCGTYNFEPSRTQAAAPQAAGAGTGIQCPKTFHGKPFVAVTLYDGPPSMQFSLKPCRTTPRPIPGAQSRLPAGIAGIWLRAQPTATTFWSAIIIAIVTSFRITGIKNLKNSNCRPASGNVFKIAARMGHRLA